MNDIITLLVRGFVIFIVYNGTVDGTRNTTSNLSQYIVNGLKLIVIIAIIANLFLGTHSENCDDDPVYGRCDTVEDYVPTARDRVSNFALYLSLLGAPMIIGAVVGFKKKKEKIEGIK